MTIIEDPKTALEPRLTFHANDFARAYRAVATAASTDRTRPTICGVLVELFADGVRLVATDSYRLFYSSVGDVPFDAEPIESHIVDDKHKRLDSLLKHATNRALFGGSDITLQPRHASMLFCLDGEQVPAAITQASYPNWRKLVTDHKTTKHCGQVAVASWLLASIEKATKIFGLTAHEDDVLRISTGADSLKPCTFTASNGGVELAGLFMPVRLP